MLCRITGPPGGPAPRTCASMTTLCSCSRWMMRSHTAGEGTEARVQFRAGGSTAQMGGGGGSLLHERQRGRQQSDACATATVQQPRTRNRIKHLSLAATGSAPLLTSCLACGKAGRAGRFPVVAARFGHGRADASLHMPPQAATAIRGCPTHIAGGWVHSNKLSKLTRGSAACNADEKWLGAEAAASAAPPQWAVHDATQIALQRQSAQPALQVLHARPHLPLRRSLCEWRGGVGHNRQSDGSGRRRRRRLGAAGGRGRPQHATTSPSAPHGPHQSLGSSAAASCPAARLCSSRSTQAANRFQELA